MIKDIYEKINDENLNVFSLKSGKSKDTHS